MLELFQFISYVLQLYVYVLIIAAVFSNGIIGCFA